MPDDTYSFVDQKLLYGPDAIDVFWYGVERAARQPPLGRLGRFDVVQRGRYHRVTPAQKSADSPFAAAVNNYRLRDEMSWLKEGGKFGSGASVSLQITGYEYDDDQKPCLPHVYRQGWPISRYYSRFTLHTLRGETALTVTQHYSATNRLHARDGARRSLDHEIICADLPAYERQQVLRQLINMRAMNPASSSLPPGLMELQLTPGKSGR